MKLAYYEIGSVFEIKSTCVNTVIIENRRLFYELLTDLYHQTEGIDGKAVLSENDMPISIAKNLELIGNFIDFSINRKSLIGKIIGTLENIAVAPEHYLNTCQLIGGIEQSIADWSFSLPCNITATKVNVVNLLKAVGIELCDDYVGNVGQAEKLIDYMELVREFDKDKLFVTVNMRSYFDDNITSRFIKTVTDHEYKVLMIENRPYNRLPGEQRLTIDEDLCEF